jgi:hypothetical protein
VLTGTTGVAEARARVFVGLATAVFAGLDVAVLGGDFGRFVFVGGFPAGSLLC